MTAHRLHHAEAVVWAILAIVGLAWYALQRLADWGGLDDPAAWGAPPQSRQTGARRARIDAAGAASVPHGCAANGAGGAL